MKQLATALVKAQEEMGMATKDSKNPFFKSKYADYNSVREVVLPALNKHKVVVLQPIVYQDGKSFVKTILMHESGEQLESMTEVVAVKQNDPQAAGSAQTYAKRYALQSFMCVGSADDDGEAAMDREPKSFTPAKKFTPKPSNTNEDEL